MLLSMWKKPLDLTSWRSDIIIIECVLLDLLEMRSHLTSEDDFKSCHAFNLDMVPISHRSGSVARLVALGMCGHMNLPRRWCSREAGSSISPASP